jgi:hypothetical protein
MEELANACLSLELTKVVVDGEMFQEIFLDESLWLHSRFGIGINRLQGYFAL